MSYKLINEALQDINALRRGNKFKKLSSLTVEESDYNDIIEIYPLGVDDLHIKLVLRTDSYGDNESVHSISIVTPIVKQVTDFEPVK